MRKQSNDVIWVDLDVDGKPLKMELNTGSAVSTSRNLTGFPCTKLDCP